MDTTNVRWPNSLWAAAMPPGPSLTELIDMLTPMRLSQTTNFGTPPRCRNRLVCKPIQSQFVFSAGLRFCRFRSPPIHRKVYSALITVALAIHRRLRVLRSRLFQEPLCPKPSRPRDCYPSIVQTVTTFSHVDASTVIKSIKPGRPRLIS
jgi:hypothetical protein